MAVDQLGELLARWRRGGGMFSRGRVLTEGIRLLHGLSGDERRVLARSLAEQGAPGLAARIEDGTGGAINADELWGLTDGLLTLDDHQLEQLAHSLRDPQERERLGREAISQLAAPAAQPATPAVPYQDRLAELPPPGAIVDPADVGHHLHGAHGTEGGAPADPHPHGAQLRDQQLGDQQLGDQELGDQELGDQELASIDVVEAGLVEVGVHEAHVDAEGGDADRAGSAAAMAVAPAGATIAARVAPPDAGTDAATDTDAGTDRDLDVEVAPDLAGVVDRAGLPGRLREATTAAGRLRMLGEADLTGLDAALALEVLSALPDGWQRRRGALRLVDARALPTDLLDSVMRRFERTTDATFVAGALLATGQVQAERFSGILPERTVQRLIARSER